MGKEISITDIGTFIDLPMGSSLNDRVRVATQLEGVGELQNKMVERASNRATDLLVASRCNASCPFCFYNPPQKIKIDSDTVATISTSAQGLKARGDKVTLYPLEPTMVPELLPVYTELSADRALTNAISLTDKMLARFRERGINKLAISLEGDRDTFCTMTGGTPQTFERVVSGIARAVESGVSVEIFLTLGRKNLDTIEWVVNKSVELGCRSCKIFRMIPTGKAQNLPDDDFINEGDVPDILRRINKLRLQYPDFPVRLSKFGPNFFSQNTYKQLAIGEKWPQSQYLCPAITNQFSGILIDKEGRVESYPVFPCFQAGGFPELQTGRYDVQTGNIFSQQWIDPDFLKERVKGKCSGCDYFEICLGDCPITMYAEGRKKGANDPFESGLSVCLTRTIAKIVDAS